MAKSVKMSSASQSASKHSPICHRNIGNIGEETAKKSALFLAQKRGLPQVTYGPSNDSQEGDITAADLEVCKASSRASAAMKTPSAVLPCPS